MKRRLLPMLLSIVLVMTGCGATTNPQNNEDTESIVNDTEDIQATKTESEQIDTSDMFSKKDYKTDYDTDKSATITLTGSGAACESDAVSIDGSIITIKDEGTYIIKGSLDNGMIIVEADSQDKLQIVLDGVNIHSETSAPLYILEADKVFMTLTEGSQNILSNGGTFEEIDENAIDGALFSKQDLTVNGTGSLVITSPAGHGIVCKDDLVLTGGSYTIESASHGMDVNDSVRVDQAELTITSGKDGIHVENTDDDSKGYLYIADGSFTIDAQGDGLSAGAYILIEDGDYQITTGGGSKNATKKSSDSWGFMGGGRSEGGMPEGGMPEGGRPEGGRAGGREMQQTQPMQQMPMQSPENTTTDTSEDSTSIKGIKAAGDLTITGGNFTMDTADDSIHSNKTLTLSGGIFEMAAGDDGVHADETLTITGGQIHISTCYEGLEGLHVAVTGGDITLVASDDGINAAGGADQSGFAGPRGQDRFGGGSSQGSILISGGNLFITSSGDGVDANGTLEISGGYTVVCGPTTGDTATLDYDVSGTISGGTFIGTGASMMAQSFSDATQGVLAVSVGNQEAGQQIEIKDSEGNTILTHTPDLSYAIVIYSTPEIVKGETYMLTVGENTGELTAN